MQNERYPGGEHESVVGVWHRYEYHQLYIIFASLTGFNLQNCKNPFCSSSMRYSPLTLMLLPFN